jgi:probable HAF family extracellular repeat protein
MKPNFSHPTSILLTLTASAAMLCTFSMLTVRAHANAIAYTVTDLGILGGTGSKGYGLNESGQVAGNALIGGTRYAVRWTGTAPENLGTLGGIYSLSYGINDSGQLAGYYTTSTGVQRAVRWTGASAEILGTVGENQNRGFGINASGQVAGYYSTTVTGITTGHAVVWTGTTPTTLGTLAGFTASLGFGINDSGQVAGHSYNPGTNPAFRAVRWTGTTPQALGTLGGSSSYGFGINDSGQIAGYAYVADNSTWHAVRWTGTTAEDLGTLGGTRSEAYGINTFGDVTGMSFTAGNNSFDAFLYTGGIMYDLNSLLLPGSGVTNLSVGDFGSVLSSSMGNSINDLGQIAATGTIGGKTHALRLDPVVTPEPSSAFLMLGSGALLLLRRRRNSV